MANNIIILGLDGCDPDHLMKWMQEGHLPFFRKMKETGIFGRLKSTIPPTTFPAWPSMMSGKNPGRLGAFDFFDMKKISSGYTLELNNTKRWLGNFIWDIAGTYKKISGIINVPFFSPTKLNGYMIDIHTGSEYPTGVIDKVSLNVESFNQYVQRPKARRTSELKRLKENTTIEFQVGNFLRSYYPECDLNIQVYNILDGTAHSTQSEKVLKDGYIYVDNALKKYFDNQDANVFIVSDHGMKKVKYRYYVNKWLLDNEYLKFKIMKKSKINYLTSIIMYKIMNIIPELEFYINDLAEIMGKKISYLSRARAQRVKEAGRTGHTKRASEIDEGIIQYPTDSVDWKKTHIFAHAANASNYIGLWFTDNEYKKNELINIIKKIKIGKQNNYVIKNIFKREDIYYGSKINKLPHLILEFRDDIMAHTSFAPVLWRSTKTYSHDLWGTLLSWGPDIKEGKIINDSQIFDIAPTILHLMDVPIPSDIDGRVLYQIFKK